MINRRGWGLLLAVALPLLLWFAWSQLQARKSSVNLERFGEWLQTDSGQLMRPLYDFGVRSRRAAGPADVVLPPIPNGSGVKAWSLANDTVLRVELDAKVEGIPVVLMFVPVIRGANGFYYDCVSATSRLHVGKFCSADSVRTVADIAAQLDANEKTTTALPLVVSASGVDLPRGTATGSVVVVPQNANDLRDCGIQCIKPQSCVTLRPLVCGKTVDEGNSSWTELAATTNDFRGDSFATRTQADKACAQSLGAGYHVLPSGSIGGVVKLSGGREYWLHDQSFPPNNCWKADYF
jgi:hypothetical protein